MTPRRPSLIAVLLAACADPVVSDDATVPGDTEPPVVDDSDGAPEDDLHARLQGLLPQVIDGVLGLRNRLLPEGHFLGDALYDEACPSVTRDGGVEVRRGGCVTAAGVGFEGVLSVEADALRAEGWSVAFEGRLQARVDGVVTREEGWDFVFVGETSGPSSAKLDPTGVVLDRYAFRSWIEGDVRPHLYELRGRTDRLGSFAVDLTAVKHDDWDLPPEWGGSARLELLGHLVELDMDRRDPATGCPTARVDGAPSAALCLL